MTEYEKSAACMRGCWWLAAGVGLVAAVILWIGAGWSLLQALFAGVVLAVICGALFGYIFCSKAKEPAVTSAPAPKPQAASAPAAAAAAPVADAPAAAATSGAAAATGARSAAAASVVKASQELPGQKELSERKGDWKYEGETKPAKKAKAKPAAKAKPTAAEKPKRAPVAADGKPELMTQPRGGAGDDLKLISGVGPKLEGMLNDMGVWHFDQVASWRKKEVQWVNDNLEGFKGRIERDNWVSQAKILAKGGETEFSARKKK